MNSKFLTLGAAFILGIFILPTSFVLAASAKYEPLIGIPGLGNGELDFGKYINALYALSISIAALMAVIKIIIAGVKYMLSDVVTSKGAAIDDIRSSVLGLIVVISAVLILTVINPQLAKTEIFLDPVTTAPNSTGAANVGTIATGNGYKTAEFGTVPNFKANCESGGGSHLAVRDAAGPKEVCYDPLTPEFKNQLALTFGADANLQVIEERYQRAHKPALITDVGRKATIENEQGGTVLLALDYSAPYDWIDKENYGTTQYTCKELQRVAGKPVVRVVSPGNGYLACIVK